MEYIEPEGIMRFALVRALFWVFALGTGVFVWAMVAAGVIGALALAAGVAYAIVATF